MDKDQSGVVTLSRAQQARAAKQKKTKGVDYELKYSGFTARVTRPSLMYLADSNQIPSELTGIVDKMLGAATSRKKAAKSVEDVAAEDLFKDGAVEGSKRLMELVNVTCLAGFVDPELVPTAEDIKDPAVQMALDEIDPDDRFTYWQWCQGMASAEAKVMTRFPATEQPVAPAQDVPDAATSLNLVPRND